MAQRPSTHNPRLTALPSACAGSPRLVTPHPSRPRAAQVLGIKNGFEQKTASGQSLTVFTQARRRTSYTHHTCVTHATHVTARHAAFSHADEPLRTSHATHKRDPHVPHVTALRTLQAEEEEFRELARELQIFERVCRSVAPAIFGSEEVKKAVACLLFGGAPKELDDGA